MSVDGMTARARQLAELEAAQASREQQARSQWSTLVERARALGQPVPDAIAGRLSSVLSARADAIDTRQAALTTLERSLADWQAGLERIEDEDRALARLRERLQQTLADEIGELSPGELSRVVARAFGDRRRTGPLGPPAENAPPPAGVEQEALLLDHLLVDDDSLDDGADPSGFEAAFGSGNGPLDTVNQPSPARSTHTIEAARIDEFDTHGSLDALRQPAARPSPEPDGADPFGAFADDAGPPSDDALVTMPGHGHADIGALLGDTAAATRKPRSLMRHPTDELAPSVDIEIDVDEADLEPGEETLSRWLGAPPDREAEPAMQHDLDAVDADIEPLDEGDSLLEWEAEGLGKDVAILVERRRPASARTSVNEIAQDPFDAFDDFDDSLDAPFGFVDNGTGQGPALPDADWSMTDGRPESADKPTIEELLLDDPFADGSSALGPGDAERSGSGGPSHDGSAEAQRHPVDTAEIDGVDMREAFPSIGAPLGADSVEIVEGPDAVESAFEDALGDVFARSAAADDSLDLDAFGAEIDAALAEDAPPPPPPARPTSTSEPMLTVSNRPTARPWAPADIDGPRDGSLLPAPADPGADGWGPRTLDDVPGVESVDDEPAPVAEEPPADDADESVRDHIATDFGAALLDPAGVPPLHNPFATPQVTLPAPAPPMASRPDERDGSSIALEPDRATRPVSYRPTTEVAAAAFGPGNTQLTGLDWPPARALHAFPDGSMDGSLERGRPRPDPAERSNPSAGTWDAGDSDLLSAALSDALDAIADDDGPEPEAPSAPGHLDEPDPPRDTGTAAYPALGFVERPAPLEPARDDAPAASEGPAFDPAAFVRGYTRPGMPHDPWRSAPVAPSASLADALEAARADGSSELDAALDELETPDDERDEKRRVTDRFAALAGDLRDDPWISIDISGDDSEGLPDLLRKRRQGRPSEPELRLPGAGARPVKAPRPEPDDDDEIAPRAPLGVRVGLEAGDRFFTGFSRDISVDGLFVHTQHTLTVGEEVEVFFELPGGRSVNARGVVRRVRRGDGGRTVGIGLRFGQLTREARVHIGRYVARTLTGKIPLP